MNAALATHDILAGQPHRSVARDGTEFVLLGTAHVSKASAEAVRDLVAHGDFDAIAIELCAHRADTMRNPEAIREMDLFRVLKEGRAGVVAAGLALGAYQRRLAEQLGIEPGAEMRAAMDGAQERSLPLWLVDRDVGTTLRRARAAVGWWERAKLSAGLLVGLLDDSEVDEAAIEKLKEGDMLESTFTEFAKQSQPLYEALIRERDRYMAARLREDAAAASVRPKRVLAVVGAGHLAGLAQHLADERAAPADVLPVLRADPPPSKFGTYFGWFLIALVVGGFAWGFSQSTRMGLDVMLVWVATTGILGAIGAAAAGAHPLSILAAAVASPVTPLHPAISSGMVSGAVELWARKPRVGDFQALRDDVTTPRGWWRNRVSRIFLVFLFTSIGTSIGVWLAGFRMAAMLSSS
jgi:pheromone shutdown-related protein TraB